MLQKEIWRFAKKVSMLKTDEKIKRIDHCKYNVRASKNAEKAFSTQ